MKQVSDVAFAAFRIVCICFVGLLIIVSIGSVWRETHPIWAVAGLALACALTLGSFLPFDASARIGDRAGIACLVALAIETFAWALIFDSQQGSDFGVYYRCGIHLQPTLDANLRACQSAYIAYGDLFWRRSLLSTVPVGLLGGGYLALKLTNAAVQCVVGLLLWLFVRRAAGPWAALAALLIYACYPDRSFALTLATSDHAALLLTVCGLGALALSDGRSAIATSLGCFGAGMSAVALDLTRSTGIFLEVAIVVVLVLHILPGRGLKTALGGVVGALVGIAALKLLSAVVLDPGARGDGFLRLVSSIYITRGADPTNHWALHFWPAIPQAEQRTVALHRLLQELIWHGNAYPAYIIEKARTLTAGIGYGFFSSADMSANRDTALIVPQSTVPQWFLDEPSLARASLFPMLGLTLAGTLRARRTALTVASMALFAAAVGEILLLGEVQPRYLMIVLPPLAILGGIAFGPTAVVGGRLWVRTQIWGVGVVAAGVCTCLCAWVIARSKAERPWFDLTAIAEGACRTSPSQVVAGDLDLTMNLPAGVVCAQAKLSIPSGTRRLSVFVTDNQFPYRFEKSAIAPIEYRIAAGPDDVHGSLDAHVVWRQLDLDDRSGPRPIVITITRKADQASGSASLTLAYPMVSRTAASR